MPTKEKPMTNESVAKKSTPKKNVGGKSQKKSKDASARKKDFSDDLQEGLVDSNEHYPSGLMSRKVKFEIYGEEMIEKKVKSSGNSGRVYLPPNWVGRQVKIIRID